LQKFYPQGVDEFKRMVDKHQIEIPGGVCANLSDAQYDTMIDVSLGMKLLWENALGANWEQKMNRDELRKIFEKL
jgi:3-deoxy-alpha-D-manno-octulosonate 8-oxidase